MNYLLSNYSHSPCHLSFSDMKTNEFLNFDFNSNETKNILDYSPESECYSAELDFFQSQESELDNLVNIDDLVDMLSPSPSVDEKSEAAETFPPNHSASADSDVDSNVEQDPVGSPETTEKTFSKNYLDNCDLDLLKDSLKWDSLEEYLTDIYSSTMLPSLSILGNDLPDFSSSELSVLSTDFDFQQTENDNSNKEKTDVNRKQLNIKFFRFIVFNKFNRKLNQSAINLRNE